MLKETIKHVVYDAYAPRQYKRTGALVEAVSSRVDIRGTPTSLQVVTTLFDDASKVSLRGGSVSAGGSAKGDVPFEIEEGTYPQPWYGFAAPRPAYAIFTSMLRPIVEQDAERIVSELL